MISETEGLAGLRILVAVAKADGKLMDEERNALEAALEDVNLPEGVTLDTLLREPSNLEAQIQRISSPAGKRETYRAAVSISYVDGECSPSEQAILDRLKAAFQLADDKPVPQGFFSDLLSETKDTLLPSNIKQIDNPKRRAAEIEEDILKYSIMSCVLGAFPVPGVAIATDIAVVALQTKLVRDIGQYYGNRIDKKAVSSLLGSVVGGAGMRIAINNLAKLIPGWGSAVGAATSFATTWGIGKMADRFFAAGGTVSPEELKAEFKNAKKEGKAAFNQNQQTIEAKAHHTRESLEQLNADLQAQRITQAEYDDRVSRLA